MPKTIDLPDTGAINLNTGEMATVAIEAIKKESEERVKEAIRRRALVIQQVREFARQHTMARIQKRSALWEDYFNDLASS